MLGSIMFTIIWCTAFFYKFYIVTERTCRTVCSPYDVHFCWRNIKDEVIYICGDCKIKDGHTECLNDYYNMTEYSEIETFNDLIEWLDRNQTYPENISMICFERWGCIERKFFTGFV